MKHGDVAHQFNQSRRPARSSVPGRLNGNDSDDMTDMIQFFGGMMKLPLTAFVYSMEMLVETMRGIQEIADQGVHTMISGFAQTPDDARGSETQLASAPHFFTGDAISDSTQNPHQLTQQEMSNQGIDTMVSRAAQTPNRTSASESQFANVPHFVTGGVIGDNTQNPHQSTQKEKIQMSSDLSNDLVKLVQYTIVTIRRREEKVLVPSTQVLVTESMTGEGFVSWVVSKDAASIPKEDQEFIRVSYSVSDSWGREDLHYEEQQLEVLRDIAENIDCKPKPK